MENVRFADDIKQSNKILDHNSESSDTSPREGYFSAPETSLSYSPPVTRSNELDNSSNSLNLLQALDKKLSDQYEDKRSKIDISKVPIVKGKGVSTLSTEFANNAIKRSLGETVVKRENRTRSPTAPQFAKSSKHVKTGAEEQLLRRAETMPTNISIKNFKDPVPHILQISMEYANTKEAAVWVPDACADDCAYCKKLFTLTRRRHHCRKCGRLFCGACSSNRLLLAYINPDHSVRVCDLCFIVQAKKSYEI